jgi:glutaminyl-peptide cyclotransferase
MKKHFFKIVFSALLVFPGCGPDESRAPQEPGVAVAPPLTPKINYTVVKRYPHDETAFTQGLLYYGDKLIESTGAPDHLAQTRSTIGEVDLESGKLMVKAEIDKKIYFGEGIAELDDRIYQVTWQNQQGFIYDAKNYARLGTFNYNNREGWGLTTDGKSLILSDGTYNLTWINPATFAVEKVIEVTKDGYGMDRLNELEYINGSIYANVWMTNQIVKIDPRSGIVTGYLDLEDLYQEAKSKKPNLSEMNGIAWHPANDRILVTGKMWPYLFEIDFPH